MSEAETNQTLQQLQKEYETLLETKGDVLFGGQLREYLIRSEQLRAQIVKMKNKELLP